MIRGDAGGFGFAQRDPVSALLVYIVVGLVVAVLAVVAWKSLAKSRWTDGLLASDRRSFETISKLHQRGS